LDLKKNSESKAKNENDEGEWVQVTKKTKSGIPTQTRQETISTKKIDDDYLDQF